MRTLVDRLFQSAPASDPRWVTTIAPGNTAHEVGAVPTRSKRVAGYLARVDAQIALLNTIERKQFLEHQLNKWHGLYQAFVATDGDSMPVTDASDPPQAADFLLTIAELSMRYYGDE